MNKGYKVTEINSNGQKVREFHAKDSSHAIRIKDRIRGQFKTGSSQQVKIEEN